MEIWKKMWVGVFFLNTVYYCHQQTTSQDDAVSITCQYDMIHDHHYFWQAPLGVRSAKRRHQSPEWTILSHVSYFIQGQVAGFQILLIHVVWGRPSGLLQFSKGKAVKIYLASVSSGIPAMWPNREKRCALNCQYNIIQYKSLTCTKRADYAVNLVYHT